MSIAEKLLTIAENEQRVYDAGFKAGQSQGGGGVAEGIKKVWDVFQRDGERTSYANALAYGNFTAETFYPTHNIICVGDTTKLFYNFSYGEPFSLTERLKDCKVTLDTSQSNLLSNAFAWASVFTEIPTIDLRGLNNRNVTRATDLFNRCTNLVTIEKIIIEEDIIIQNWFVNNYALENITIEGTIGQNGFDIHWSTKLSKESLLSILGACNIDVTSSPVTITLPSKCIDGTTDTKTLLEGLGGKIEYTQGLETANGQLKHTNIVPNSVIITPYGPDGNQCNSHWVDDGNGNIIHPDYPTEGNMHIMGTINYETGKCTLPIYIEGFQESVKIQYRVESPYTKALANGYKIEFA